MDKILETIKKLRSEKGYSQEFMGRQLGIEQSTYYNIEVGKTGLQYKTLEKIAEILGMRVIDVITYPEKYVSLDTVSKETLRAAGKISVTFEVPEHNRELLLKMISGE